VRLKDRPTRIERPPSPKRALRDAVRQLADLQSCLAAESGQALLIILQGMDASGKNSLIKHVLSGLDPQSLRVADFKRPTPEEAAHDFLWRCHWHTPKRGEIAVFNRSYYEEVLVPRVHPRILREQGLAPSRARTARFWARRFRSINAFERHLADSGTAIVKVFLHLSKAEQRRRFLRRLEKRKKRWKFDPADMAERRKWHRYWKAYEACFKATSTRLAPWHVVPADDKKTARVLVSQIILESLRRMRPKSPRPDRGRRKTLRQLHQQLAKKN
jgi:PPK2 family polyphosphate:nucleotide phosphotransferase